MQSRDRKLGLLDRGEDIDAALIECAPGLGRADAARRPIEQARAQQLLQLHHGFAHRRAREAELAAGLGIAAQGDHLGEGIHPRELVQPIVSNLDTVWPYISRLSTISEAIYLSCDTSNQ